MSPWTPKPPDGRAFGSKAWFTDPAVGRELAGKLGIRRLPALAVYLNGELLGAIEGLRNWEEYQVELINILTAKAKPHKKTLTIAPVQA